MPRQKAQPKSPPKAKEPLAWAKATGVSVDMRDICQEMGFGYSPGVALVLERVKLQIYIEELEGCVDKDFPHPDSINTSTNFGVTEMSLTKELLTQARERASALDLQLMPYVHPKLTANKQELDATSVQDVFKDMLEKANERHRAKA